MSKSYVSAFAFQHEFLCEEWLSRSFLLTVFHLLSLPSAPLPSDRINPAPTDPCEQGCGCLPYWFFPFLAYTHTGNFNFICEGVELIEQPTTLPPSI